jgi:hypothetical protein
MTKKKKTTLTVASPKQPMPKLLPLGAQEAALCHIIAHTMDGELALDQSYEKTEEHCLAWLNTQLKHKI